MLDDAAQRRPLRQQDREMEEPQPATPGRTSAGPLAQLDERPGTRSEHGGAGVPSELGEAESRAVEL